MAKAPSTTASAQRVFFTNTDDALDLPSLVDHQNKSFQWFVEEGLGELLAEISPIDDYTGGKLSLRFKDYKFGEPKLSEATAREKEKGAAHQGIQENSETPNKKIDSLPYFGGQSGSSAHSRPAAALAFYDLVALLEQALALAIPALLLLLDVGAFFVGHEELQALGA